MTIQNFILFISLTAFTSCQSVEKRNIGYKKQFSIIVEVVPEGNHAYSISWKDTLGKGEGYGLNNRPYEVWCFIKNNSGDTLGHYRGLSTPTNYTYFSTSDTTVKVAFMIGPNIFSDQREKKISPESIIKFDPVVLNLRSNLRNPFEIVLIKIVSHQ